MNVSISFGGAREHLPRLPKRSDLRFFAFRWHASTHEAWTSWAKLAQKKTTASAVHSNTGSTWTIISMKEGAQTFLRRKAALDCRAYLSLFSIFRLFPNREQMSNRRPKPMDASNFSRERFWIQVFTLEGRCWRQMFRRKCVKVGLFPGSSQSSSI